MHVHSLKMEIPSCRSTFRLTVGMPGANPGLAARLRAEPLHRWECLDMSDLIRILNRPLDVPRCLLAIALSFAIG
jgi:hypothetical protein